MSVIYGDLTSAATYHSDRNSTAWADTQYSDVQRSAALLVASEWIDERYREWFPGIKPGQRAQEREWPRNGAVDWRGYRIDNLTIPNEVLYATFEVALQQLVSAGSLNTNFTLNKNKKSVSISGAIAVVYSQAWSVEDAQLMMPIVDKIIYPVLTGNGADGYGLGMPVSPLSGSISR